MDDCNVPCALPARPAGGVCAGDAARVRRALNKLRPTHEGAGREAVTVVGLAFVAWSTVLVAVGLRTTFRLPWRGVGGALLLAGVMVAAFAVLPSAL